MIPLFILTSCCPLHMSSHITQCPVSSKPGGCRPPGKRQTSSRPQEWGDRRWLAGLESGREHGELTLSKTVWVHPGDVHFSQGPLSSPYPSSHSRTVARARRKGFIPTKNKTNFSFCPRSISNPLTPLLIQTWWTSSTGYVVTALVCYLLQSGRIIWAMSISPRTFSTPPPT